MHAGVGASGDRKRVERGNVDASASRSAPFDRAQARLHRPALERACRRTRASAAGARQAALTVLVRTFFYALVLARCLIHSSPCTTSRAFLLQRVQPALIGLIDGSLSTLAPIFAVALATHNSHYAFFAGLATSIGAAVAHGFSEGLSDTGELTGRGNPVIRGAITGSGTFIGGVLHTLPFLIPHYHIALFFAVAVVTFELVMLACFRWQFFATTFVARSGRHLRRRHHCRRQREHTRRGPTGETGFPVKRANRPRAD